MAWSYFGTGANNTIRCAATASNGDVYVAGEFTEIDGVSANRIAKWNGTNWSALGAGVNARISDIAINGTDIYIAGEFTEAGGNAAKYAAKWNGSAWSAIGTTNINAVATSVGVDASGVVFLGGAFTQIGDVVTNYLAKWNGSAWSAIGADNVPYSMWKGADFYIGGLFAIIGGANASRIAAWNGINFAPLSSGVNGQGDVIRSNGSSIYCGGNFTEAGGNAAKYVAKWNGTNWSALGAGVNARIFGLYVSAENNIYCGGNFTEAGEEPANRIAKWDGTNWSTLGAGVNASVFEITPDKDGNLIVVGSFTEAGGESANRIAKWTPEPTNSITPTPDTLNFGTQKTFIPSTSQSVDIEFVGAFTNIAITSPAGFKVSKDNTTWSSVAEYATAEDETKTVYFRAYSETAGTFNGNAVISTDELDDVNIALTLEVTASSFVLEVTPSTLSFGTQFVGQASVPQVFTVELKEDI